MTYIKTNQRAQNIFQQIALLRSDYIMFAFSSEDPISTRNVENSEII